MQLSTPIEPAWKTYLKSAIFLAPAFAFSAVAAVFILPKLKTVWRDAGIDDTPEIWMVHTTDAILGNGMLTFWIILGAIILLELALKKNLAPLSPRYPRNHRLPPQRPRSLHHHAHVHRLHARRSCLV